MSPVSKAEELIALLAPGGRRVPIRVPLEEDESRWFLNAVQERVVVFEDCPNACNRARKYGLPGPDHFRTPAGDARHLFSNPTADPAWLNREYIPHIAAYAAAVVAGGYASAASSFSRYRTFSRDLINKRMGGSYETDAEFYDPGGRVWLQIEAKASRAQTAQLASQIEARGRLQHMPPKLAKEIEYVLDLRPRYLWVVGPGSIDPAQNIYAVNVQGLDASFTACSTLPAPP